MKIAMFTNTYVPHVGGVARSVDTLAAGCRKRGHEVKVIAPELEGSVESPDILRVPSIQNFNGSDFCVRLPVPSLIRDFMEDFAPDVIHSHHPFLLGDAALREAWKLQVPIIFTHHTLYERYTHYMPLDSDPLKRAAIQLATEYCNLCSQVIAPSESIAALLEDRGVISPVEVVPTGIDVHGFALGDGMAARTRLGIPPEARIIGHIGRLAREKNLVWLAEAVRAVMQKDADSVFLLVGDGDVREELLASFEAEGLGERVYAPGKLTGQPLADAYAALDVFVFASQTETQGMVLAEAMAAGKPVVALDGPGVRDIVEDGANGTLLPEGAEASAFADALARVLRDDDLRQSLSDGARESAARYDAPRCVDEVIECYEQILGRHRRVPVEDEMIWDRFLTGVGIEWDLFTAKLSAASAAVFETSATTSRLD